ncbi:MAG TPA: TatD family hydrolase [Candidatus Limnocylindria bacterium]|nr:TatD family hydrolase [Candidatus Limnocylindria bacterium]
MGRRPGQPAARRGDAALPEGRAARRCRGRGAVLSRRRGPDALPGLVDSHCHLQDAAFDPDREAVLARAAAAGIERLLGPGFDLPSTRRAVELARRHPGTVQAAVGIHPHFSAAATDADWEELARLAAAPEVAAVGEMGLDFFRNLSPPEIQRAALARQLDLATRVGKPVLVHDRDAHDEIRSTLLAWGGRGVLHAFSGDAGMAHAMTSAGFLVSFALPVTFRSAEGPRAAAATLPDHSFLVETDSPWLAPGGAGARNEPTTALRVAVELARLRSVAPQELAAQVRGAYDRLLGG